jgi:hypothetical protein
MSKFKYQIGTKVDILAKAYVNYNEQQKRVLYRDIVPPITCQVCGVVRKALGKYHRGGKENKFQFDDYPDPPYLKVSTYIFLYECRTKLNSKPFLVHPDDIRCLQ